MWPWARGALPRGQGHVRSASHPGRDQAFANGVPRRNSETTSGLSGLARHGVTRGSRSGEPGSQPCPGRPSRTTSPHHHRVVRRRLQRLPALDTGREARNRRPRLRSASVTSEGPGLALTRSTPPACAGPRLTDWMTGWRQHRRQPRNFDTTEARRSPRAKPAPSHRPASAAPGEANTGHAPEG